METDKICVSTGNFARRTFLVGACTGLSLQAPNASPWEQTYGYDAAGRLTSVTSPAGGFTYILGGTSSASPLVKELLLPNGAYITNVYDGNGRLTGTALQNSGGTNIDAEGYVYNPGNQRTQQVYTAGNFMNYTYDSIGELQTALGKEPGGVTNRLHEQFGYTYDAAGNLKNQTNNALVRTLFANSLNELYLINHGGTLTVEGTTTSPATNVTVNTSNAVLYVDNTFASANQGFVSGTNIYTAIATDGYGRMGSNTVQTFYPSHANLDYDLNGNLTSENEAGGRNFAYDDENQLIAVWVTNSWMSQFTYDGKMRRRIRGEYNWQSATSAWQLTNEVHYIYDGNAVIQERDANNLPQVTYTRGTDLSGSLQGAGGIGGLLARTANPSTINPQLSTSATAYYHSDGNGNITCLINTNQSIVAKYEYDPYGNILSQLGSLADANLYRFSSKEYHPASGLVYYARRFYDPNLQRWLTRDPLFGQGFAAEALGAIGVYQFVENDPVNSSDPLGLLTAVFVGNYSSRGWPPNPFGHAAIAFSGDGVFSFGTPDSPLGSSFTAFINNQATYRSGTIYILNTTPEQEQEMEDFLDSESLDIGYFPDNCADRVLDALAVAGLYDSEGFDQQPVIGLAGVPTGGTTGTLPFPFAIGSQLASDPGVIQIHIQQGTTLPGNFLTGFNPPLK